MMVQGRACARAKSLPSRYPTVQWNEPLDAVLVRMDATAGDEALVMQGDHPVGRILRADIEQLQRRGNWAGCIAAADAMGRAAKLEGR